MVQISLLYAIFANRILILRKFSRLYIHTMSKQATFLTSWPISKLWLLLILITILSRLPVLLHPRPIDDERIYSVVATELIKGGQLYVDAIERKPPLLFWIYSAIYKISGAYNAYGLHLISLIWLILTMWGVYLLGRTLFNPFAGWTMALLYSIYQHWAVQSNVALNGEIMMNLPIVFAIWLCIKQSKRFKLIEIFTAGILLCSAFLLKQPGAIAAVPLGLYFLLPTYQRQNNLNWINGFVRSAVLTIGFIFMLGATCWILYNDGILEQALFWTIGHHDIPHGITDVVFWIRGGRIGIAFLAACLPLTIGTYLSLSSSLPFWIKRRPEWILMWLFFLASLIGTSASGRFYPHYFIQMVLPMCILAGFPIAAIINEQTSFRSFFAKRKFMLIWIGLSIVGFNISHWAGLSTRRAPLKSAIYVKENSQKSDRIFVWGQKPVIYYDAQRRPSTRYIATFPLTGYLFGSPHSWDPNYDTSYNIVEGSWESFAEDLGENPPIYIVDVDGARKVPRYPIRNYELLEKLLLDFEKVAEFDDGIVYKRKGPGS